MHLFQTQSSWFLTHPDVHNDQAAVFLPSLKDVKWVIRDRNKFSRLFYTDGSLMSLTYFGFIEDRETKRVR